MKARSGYQVRAVRRTRCAVMLGATPGHVAPRHAMPDCAGSRAGGTSRGNADSHVGAALPTLAQTVLRHRHVGHKPCRGYDGRARAGGQTAPHREHGELRQDTARRTGPRWATGAPRRAAPGQGPDRAESATSGSCEAGRRERPRAATANSREQAAAQRPRCAHVAASRRPRAVLHAASSTAPRRAGRAGRGARGRTRHAEHAP
jgi:hypothetical protein